MADTGHSKLFKEMAEKIDHNSEATFGGAVVIVPPEGCGKPISVLMLDNSMDGSQFWASLKTKCDIQLTELATAQRTNTAFRR